MNTTRYTSTEHEILQPADAAGERIGRVVEVLDTETGITHKYAIVYDYSRAGAPMVRIVDAP